MQGKEMMAFHYAGESVLLTDDVCDALLSYAQTLAETCGSDVVTVPVSVADGTTSAARFLLGPASQIYATPVPDSEQRTNPDVVEDLHRRARLRHPTAVPTAEHDDSDEGLGFDYD